jgi:flagellar biosynthesis GTPase FlhF
MKKRRKNGICCQDGRYITILNMQSQDIRCLVCREANAMFVCLCQVEPVFICKECFNSHMNGHSRDVKPVSMSRLRMISAEEQLATYGENLGQRVEICYALYRYKETVLDLQKRLLDSRDIVINRLQEQYHAAESRYDSILSSINKCFQDLCEASRNRQTEKLNQYYNNLKQDSLKGLVEYYPNLSFDDSELNEAIKKIFNFGYNRVSTQELIAQQEETSKLVSELTTRIHEKDELIYDLRKQLEEQEKLVPQLQPIMQTQESIISDLQKQLEVLKQESAENLLKYNQEEESHLQDLFELNTYKTMERNNYQYLFKSPFIYIAMNKSSSLLQFDCFTSKTTRFDLNTDFVFNVTSSCVIPGGDVFIAGCTNPPSKRAFIFKIANQTLVELEEMSVARFAHGMVWYRDWVYVFGGMNVNKAERFSLVHKLWDQLPNDMNECRYCFCAIPVNNKIYLIGGDSTNTIEQFDIQTLTFSYLPVTIDYDSAVAAMTNDKIYILSKNNFYIMNNEMKLLSKHENVWNNPKLTLCNSYTRSDCMIYFNSQFKLYRPEFLKFHNRELKFGERFQ